MSKPMNAPPQTLRLRLYVMSDTPRSAEALKSLREIAETRLAGRYELEVIDVRNEPFRALADGALIVPTLILTNEDGEQQVLGNLSDTKTVLKVLGLSEP